MSLFLETYFEKMFPFRTIILGLVLGILLFFTDKTKERQKGLKVLLGSLHYAIKYIMACWLTFVYIVFIDYLRVSDIVLSIYYTALAIMLLALIVLDLIDIYKWYKNITLVKVS